MLDETKESIEEVAVQTEPVPETAAQTEEPSAANARALPPVSVKTNVDAKAVTALGRRLFLSRWYVMAIPAVLLAALGGLIWGILSAMFIEGGMAIGISLMAAGLAVPAVVFAVRYALLAKQSEKATQGRTKVLNFMFDENAISVTQTTTPYGGESKEETTEFAWDDIAKVVETQEYCFLLLGGSLSIIADKSGMTDASRADFNNLLKAKLGDKYKAA